MELLERVEGAVGALIEATDEFRRENARLSGELAALAQENRELREALSRQAALRAQAVERIDGLLRKVRNYEKVDQVDL